MSWSMWHIYGSGFDCAKADPEKYKDFVLKHEVSLKHSEYLERYELLDYLVGTSGSEVDFEDIRDITQSYTIADPVAAIMSHETGIVFDFPGMTDDECEEYVLFCARDPWDYNEKEKGLTVESLKAIMEPYARELGLGYEEDVDLVYAG